MPDGFVKYRQGEKRPVFGQETFTTGTLTIAPLPAPSVTMYDAGGSVVGGFNGIPATGYDSGAQSAPRVWLVLDTSGLAAGFYTVVFAFSGTASDGTVRQYEPSIEVQVLAMTE